jgi:hypothetical protein
MDKHIQQDIVTYDTSVFFTPLDVAVEEIRRRRNDPELISKVNAYLKNDAPKHLDREVPVLYLARHIATPNFEALRFIELCKPYDLPMVIGQDSKAKFVTHNELKLSLGKMQIVKGLSHNRDEILENFSIIDLHHAQGKPVNQLHTKFGERLIDFHNSLLREIYPDGIEIHDEADWVDRNHRDNLLEQYKKMLALTCVHSVMFETYLPQEKDFLETILRPAFKFIESTFGVRPLITELVPNIMEHTKNWNSYPSVLYSLVKNRITKTMI